MPFELPSLPYDYDALEPHMSAETLRYHHGKHHKSYVDKLNAAIEGTDMDGLTLEEVIHRSAGSEKTKAIFNNAAQTWNHAFFWNCMTPNGGGIPGGQLGAQIEGDFGGFDQFRDAFKAAATGQFGSGWAWLVLDNGRLKISSTSNAELPMTQGHLALLTCDVWEHAYYIDYRNDRGAFIDAYLDQLVNWDFAAERFTLRREGSLSSISQYVEA